MNYCSDNCGLGIVGHGHPSFRDIPSHIFLSSSKHPSLTSKARHRRVYKVQYRGGGDCCVLESPAVSSQIIAQTNEAKENSTAAFPPSLRILKPASFAKGETVLTIPLQL